MPNNPAKTNQVILHTRKDWYDWYRSVKSKGRRNWKHFSPEDDHEPGPSLIAPESPDIELPPPLELDEGMTADQREGAVSLYHLNNMTLLRNTRWRLVLYSYELQKHYAFKEADRKMSDHINATVSAQIRSEISDFSSAAARLAYLYKHYKEDFDEACRDAAEHYDELMLDFSLTESWIARWEKAMDNCMRLELVVTSRGGWLKDLRFLVSPLDQETAFAAYYDYREGGKLHDEANVTQWAQKLRHLEQLSPQRATKSFVRPYACAVDASDDVSQAHRKRRRSEAATDEQQPPSRRPRQARYGQKPLCKACNQAVHQIDRCWAVFPHKAPSTVSSSDLDALKHRMEAAAAQDPVLRVEIHRARQREANSTEDALVTCARRIFTPHNKFVARFRTNQNNYDVIYEQLLSAANIYDQNHPNETFRIADTSPRSDQFMVERRFHGPSRSALPVRTKQSDPPPRAARPPSNDTPPRVPYKCYACHKENCWSTNHSKEEQDQARKAFREKNKGASLKTYNAFLLDIEETPPVTMSTPFATKR
ncbi:hypothetical protein SEPCBS119000_006049 [Sporothrix epigloea]|uniref:Gag protein n=1 Tax=Sporothrix epigloea TaxID=1892477 RepID=A0ABP0E0X0_9PEZI